MRYSNIDYHHDEEGLYNETSFLSDLYFSDIYKEDKTSFEDWDSNNNGVFSEWTWSYNQSSGEYDILKNKDEIDLTPDVSVGRLPCRNIFEVISVTKKIISYETVNQKGDWFKNMILVGGDTVPPPDGTAGIYEGILETMLALSYMKPLGFSFKKLWVNTSDFNGRQDVIDAVNEGAGFFYLTGHGNPAAWSTYPADSDDELINGLFVWDMKKLSNKERLPICIIGGCHNSQFDVTVRNLLRNPLGSLIYGSFIRECWSWRLVNKRGGGAIACIGNTAIGYGEEGYDTVDATDGWISTRFFKVYADHVNNSAEKPILGDIHSTTIGDYIENFDMQDNELHSKTVQQWALIGDPSMRIG